MRIKPDLSQTQIKNRVAFCHTYSAWDVSRGRKVLWSDEAMFCISGSQGGDIYRRRDSDPLIPKYTKKYVKHPDKIMVWGCFGFHGLGELAILPKNKSMNKNNYLELLCDYLPEMPG